MTMSTTSGSDNEWEDEKTLTKTHSSLTESDLEYTERSGSKQQSSLFIHKLYEMASCDAHAHVFGFSEDGMSLKIRRPADLGPVLLRYFKHSNTSSFIRQLNNYGFKTISSVSNGNSVQTFAHPYFHREGKDMLDSITRKTAKNVKKCKGDIIKELQHVETEYRKRFREMENKNKALEVENKQLHQEIKRLKTMVGDVFGDNDALNNKNSCHPQMLQPLAGFMTRVSSITCNPQFSFAPMPYENCGPEPLMLEMPRSISIPNDQLVRPFGYDDGYDPNSGSTGPLLNGSHKIVDEDIISSLMETEGPNSWPFASSGASSSTGATASNVKTEYML